jgi:hypothetical protein
VEEFMLWYEEEKEKVFHFREELEEYNKSDTLLLQEGCLAFRKEFMEISGGIDPFQVS